MQPPLQLFLMLFCLSHKTITVSVSGQNCDPITQDLLGSSSVLSSEGLIPSAYNTRGDGQIPPDVQILDFNVVCEQSGDRINTARGVSVLVRFDCDSDRNDLSNIVCTGGVDDNTVQFQFACLSTSHGNQWSTAIAGSSAFAASSSTMANLATPLENTCGLCIDDAQISGSDPVTHCFDCHPDCNRGQMRCFGTGPSDCCNYYQLDWCVVDCGSGLVPNSEFICGCPAPTITNGQVSSTRIAMIGDTVTYSCDALANLIGVATRTCTLNGWDEDEPTCDIVVHAVKEETPRFTQEPSDRVVFEEDAQGNRVNLVLHCMVTGNPQPNVTWFMGDDVQVNPQFVMDDGRLVIPNITEGQYASRNGVLYYCIASNVIGRADSKFTTTIRSREANVTYAFFSGFTEDVNPTVNVTVSSNVALRCDVGEANPPPIIQWFNDIDINAVPPNGLLDPDGNTDNVFYLDGGRYLAINLLDQSQINSQYRCHVTNVNTFQRQVSPTIYSLTDNLPLNTLVDYKSIGNVTAFVTDDEVEFSYIGGSRGNAPGIFSQCHLFNRTESLEILTSLRGIGSIEMDEIPTPTLTSNEFSIHCQIGSSDATAIRSGTLRVYQRATITSSPPGNREFVVGEADTIPFTCMVDGVPTPEIEWYINGQEVRRDNANGISIQGNTLTIAQPNPFHSGMYQCFVSNEFATDLASWVLEVRELNPPTVEVADNLGMHQVGVETRDGVSGTISLSFIIRDTYPPIHEDDIIWTYINATRLSGETLDGSATIEDLLGSSAYSGGGSGTNGGILDVMDERFSISTTEHGIHTLSIRSLQFSDSGVYSLTASNEIGSDTASINLTVHVEPILLSMSVLDEMDTFDEGQSTSFSCTADGFPPPIIVWLHNGTLIDTNLQQRFSTNVDLVDSNHRPHVPQATTSTLLVRDLHLRDSGEYICRADPPVTGQSDVAMTPIILRVEAQPIDHCLGMPCMNGGTCVSLEDGFLCECIEDRWRGVMCEIAVIKDEPAMVVSGPQHSFSKLFKPVNLTCDVTGSPQPEITWYKDDELLEGQRLSYLFIDEVELSDRGMYYCVASNTIQDPENPSRQDQSDPAVLNIEGIVQYFSALRFTHEQFRRKRQTDVLQNILSLLSAHLSGVNISGSDATVYSVTTTSHREMESQAVPLLITLLSPNSGDSVLLEKLKETLDSVAMVEDLAHLNISFDSIQRFDGCPADTTVLPALSDDGTPVILDWPEVDLGVNYTLQCPCGNLSALGGDVNRKAYRFCGGDFTTGATWSVPIQQACNFSEVTRQLCQVSNLIEEPKEAIVTLETITDNEDNIGALEVGITAVLLDSLSDAVVMEQNISLTENLLTVVDNILDVEGDQLQQSQEESNSSAMILDVLGRVAESVPIPENKTEVIIPLRSFAVSVREIEPESFTGLTFSALLGDSFDFSQNDENIDANSLVFDEQETQPTASISIPEDIFGSLMTSSPNMNTTTPRRIVHSVYLTDSLFGRREESEFQVGSIVISAAISGGVKVEGLKNPIMMQFIKSPDVANGTQTMCNFWDIQADDGFGNWSGRGCWVVNETEEDVTCACDHLTNFAILLDVSPDNTTKLPDELAKTLLAVSYIGAILSIILLTLTIITYLSVQKLRSSVPGQLLINLCLALIGIYVMFIVAYYLTTVTVKLRILCAVAGGLLQYFMLVTFSIMAAEAVIVYIKFVKVFGCTAIQHRYVLKTALISWIVPLVIVIVSLGPNYRNYIGEQICRPYNLPFYVGLIAPFLAVYVFNWIMFLIIFISLLKRHLQRKEVDVNIKTGNRKAKQQFVIAVTLSLLFGLGWGFGLPATNRISSVPLRTVLQAIFIFVTAFHGVFVFVMQCVRQQEARNEWKRWFNVVICCRRPDKACAFSLKLPRSYDGDTLPGLYSKTSTMSTIPSKEPNNTVVFENEGSKYPSSDYSKNTTHISCTEATCTV